MMSEIVKICKKHGSLTKDDCYKSIYYRCKKCAYIKAEEWRIKNPLKAKEIRKKYHKDNKEKMLEKQRLYNRSDKSKAAHRKAWKEKNYTKKYHSIPCKELHEKYVIQQIIRRSNLKKEDVPYCLIEITKIYIQLKRKIKELKNGNK